jgi:hypothetical protein
LAGNAITLFGHATGVSSFTSASFARGAVCAKSSSLARSEAIDHMQHADRRPCAGRHIHELRHVDDVVLDHDADPSSIEACEFHAVFLG